MSRFGPTPGRGIGCGGVNDDFECADAYIHASRFNPSTAAASSISVRDHGACAGSAPDVASGFAFRTAVNVADSGGSWSISTRSRRHDSRPQASPRRSVW